MSAVQITLLFEEYSKHPMITRLAIEIRLIDDPIAALPPQHGGRKRRTGQGGRPGCPASLLFPVGDTDRPDGGVPNRFVLASLSCP